MLWKTALTLPALPNQKSTNNMQISIRKWTKKTASLLNSAAEDLQKLTTAMAPKELQENLTVKAPNRKVVSFQKVPVTEGKFILVMSSSVVKKLAFDKTLPKTLRYLDI